ncbi:MAG: hypothetical protein CMB80_19450 [Flammeovirgaceae bacterium]|nr:hypothetical protein [Flammeovirgaceae bacterium]HCX22545.1 hypothetical protein [Cytophagales bacterium]|tara:strand:- start:2254 stop:2901 length:648 start_codon:yes stop_codon:yes gene_type:complete
MSTFNNIEKELILKALANRRANSQGEFNKKHLIELEKIECELKFEYSHLTPKNKSILIGCLRETYIYPNKYILNLSEYQLTFMRDELLSTLSELDVVMNLLNGLLKKSESKYHLFAESLNKIDRILNSQRILYSTTTDGKIYKAGILLDRENGITFELDGWSEPTNFEIGKLHPQYFQNNGTTSEIRTLLTNYSLNHELTEMQKSFGKILERVSG